MRRGKKELSLSSSHRPFRRHDVIACNNGDIALAKRPQGSTMGQKIWLSLRPKKIMVLKKSSMRTYIRPPIYVSRGEISRYKHPRVSAVNRIATQTFREKRKQQQSRVFLSTKF